MLFKKPVCLNDVISQSFAMVSEFAKSKGLMLSVSHRDELPRWIESDDIRLKGILVELLSSIIRLTHYGNVSVTTKLKTKQISNTNPQDWIKWYITGTGLNLTDAIVCSQFDPPSAHIQDRKKTSIMLFISKNLIDAFGGKLRVKSKDTKGSYLSFSIPNNQAPELVVKDSVNYLRESSVNIMMTPEETKCICPKVLVIDSNPMNQYVVSSLLDRLKVPNKIAQDLSTAVSIIEERMSTSCCHCFNLIIIDASDEQILTQVFL